MILRSGDKKLVKDIAHKLRIAENQYQTSRNLSTVDIDGQSYSTLERPCVVITKKDLREFSGRKHVRKSYQNEIVKELNNQWGIYAKLEGDKIYAESVPLRTQSREAMSLGELKNLKEDND